MFSGALYADAQQNDGAEEVIIIKSVTNYGCTVIILGYKEQETRGCNQLLIVKAAWRDSWMTAISNSGKLPDISNKEAFRNLHVWIKARTQPNQIQWKDTETGLNTHVIKETSSGSRACHRRGSELWTGGRGWHTHPRQAPCGCDLTQWGQACGRCG